MRTILISLILAGIASAEVPSLINYQGRLTNAEGEPLTGTKNFELKIFDSKTEGNLLYTENVGAIQLAEGGVYSFQFGGTGTSNTQTTELVGGGDGSVLYQKVLSNTPVVEGSVSVSDGTYTWSEESGSSNEDDFSSSFSKNLGRITVNYFAEAPNDSRQIEVTYRYQSEGIMGAFGSGAEHWLQISIDGEAQSTRERVLAVPFALYAGKLAEKKKSYVKTYYQVLRGRDPLSLRLDSLDSTIGGSVRTLIQLPSKVTKINRIKAGFNNGQPKVKIEVKIGGFANAEVFTTSYEFSFNPNENKSVNIDSPLEVDLDPKKNYFVEFKYFYWRNNNNRFYWEEYLEDLNKPVDIHYSE